MSTEENLSLKTMISLLVDGSNVMLGFAKAAQPLVGFMQSILELLTVPGDIVMDWTVACGNTFWAGEYSG